MKTSQALDAILIEYGKATKRYCDFHSAHEGYSILLEEVDELWDEIKKSPVKRDQPAMTKEAIQVAAMALRFLTDLC